LNSQHSMTWFLFSKIVDRFIKTINCLRRFSEKMSGHWLLRFQILIHNYCHVLLYIYWLILTLILLFEFILCLFLTLFYIYHYMYYYMYSQDSNADCLCLTLILFISTITKEFGYNFDILLFARYYVHLFMFDFMAFWCICISLMYITEKDWIQSKRMITSSIKLKCFFILISGWLFYKE